MRRVLQFLQMRAPKLTRGLKEGLVMEDAFVEDADDQDNDETEKTNSVKNVLDKRRQLDDKIDERRLRRQLRDYDFDLDD